MTVNKSHEESLPGALEGPASLPTLTYIAKGYANEKTVKVPGFAIQDDILFREISCHLHHFPSLNKVSSL